MSAPLAIPSRPGLRAVPVVATAYFLVYAAWVVVMLAGAARRGIVNDLLFLPLYLGPAWLSFRAGSARSDEPRLARGWKLVGAAWLGSALGSLAWILYRAWPSAGFDAVGWLSYNLYYPLSLLGLWHFFEMPARGDSRIRLGVECLIVAVATVVLAWYFVFRFDEASREFWPFLQSVGVLFLGEWLLLIGATAVLHRPARHADAGSLTMFGIAILAAGVADFIYQQSMLVPSAWSGPTGDLLLAFAATLVMMAAWRTSVRRTSVNGSRPAVAVGLALLPYLAVGVVAALLVLESTKAKLGNGPIAGLIVGGALLLVLVIGRLLVAQREYAHEAGARAAQDARFKSLVQRSSDGILVLDRAGQIGYASPAFCRMVGASEAAVVGRRLADFGCPDQTIDITTWLETSAARPLGKWRIGRVGAWREVEAIATDMPNESVAADIVVNIRDVTERIRLEALLIQAQKLEIVGRLSSSIAHDFNNLLMVISGNLELARLSEARGESADLGVIEAAARRGAALARQLLSLSRPTEPSLRVVDLSAAVRTVEPTLRNVLPSSITLTVNTRTVPAPVLLDEVQAEQVLLNLALNARDAMPTGGTLDVSVEVGHDGDRAFLTVSDTGMGMSGETLAHAFEPFFTTKSGRGTGLGLPTVRRIVTGAGGRADIVSGEGTGTTARIQLPLVATIEEAETPRRPAPVRGAGHVLVVEDDPAVRRLLVRQLTRVGYTVAEASDGRIALEVLRAALTPVDVVLTDLVMPNMGGEALTRQLAKEFPALPVLCMSGTPGLATDGGEPWSADLIIAKPADLGMVTRRIADAMTRARATQPDQV